MLFDPQDCCRVLVIDDDRNMQEIFRRILIKSDPPPDEEVSNSSRMPCFEIDAVDHGEDGLNLIAKSLQENRPYSLAFVDVRMAPGWDGIKTTCEVWAKYCELQVVICTEYSDYTWEKM